MMLTDQQMSALNRDGFLMLPSLFNVAEVDRLHSRLSRLLDQPHEANVIEKQSGKVRTAMGLHLRDELFAKLVRHPRLLDPARQILDQPFLYPAGQGKRESGVFRRSLAVALRLCHAPCR